MTTINLVAMVISTGATLVVTRLIQTRKLRESYAFLWLVASLTALAISIYPPALADMLAWLEIQVPLNLIYFLYLLFLSLLLLQLTLAISKQALKIELLAKEVALLRAEVESKTQDV